MHVTPRAVLAAWISAFVLFAVAQPLKSGAGPSELLSTSNDAEQVTLTIYNGSTSLVHDRRHVNLAAGPNTIAWRDVSGNIDATSALLDDITTPGGVSVVEQNFDFDLLNPQSLLDKYVGQTVTVVHDRPVAGRPTNETATVLADNDGVVLKYANRIESGLYDSHIAFPAIPDNLRDRPTLVLQVDAAKDGLQDIDLSYLTGGLSWYANYTGIIDANEDRMHVNGLVTLSNTTGTTFPNARLNLVAGNVNIAPPPSRCGPGTYCPHEALDSYTASPRKMTQENFFEYHLYSLERPTTVANAQTKQVSLLSASDVPVRKTLELRGSSSYYLDQTPDDGTNSDLGDKLKVGVYVTFTNKGGDLGVPLPGGVFRLYKDDNHGMSQFLGSDTIDHTPRDQDVRLHVGDSFDVTANKKQTDFQSIDDCSFESTYRIAVSNAKDEAQEVLVIEPIPGDWTITAESLTHVKSSSASATWTLHIPSRSTTTLTYTATVRNCR